MEINLKKGLPSGTDNNFDRRLKAIEEGYTFILSKEVSLTDLDRYNDPEEIKTLKDLSLPYPEGKKIAHFLFCYSKEAMDLIRPLPFLEFLSGYDALLINLDHCLWNSMDDAETILFNKLFKESKKPVYLYFSSDSYPTLDFIKGLLDLGLAGIIIKDNGQQEKIESFRNIAGEKILIEKDNIIQ